MVYAVYRLNLLPVPYVIAKWRLCALFKAGVAQDVPVQIMKLEEAGSVERVADRTMRSARSFHVP